MNRRGFVGLLAGLSGLLTLGRTKPSESTQGEVIAPEKGRKLYAVTDWACGMDVAVTCVYWRDTKGDYYIEDMYQCTSEQIEEERCPCRRYLPNLRGHHEEYLSDRLHFDDLEGRFLDAGGEPTPWGFAVIPVKI